MGQSIKSLSEQMKGVSVEGFAVTKLKKGDYGYNLVYGMVDDTVEVAFRIDYIKNDDENAAAIIERALNDGVETVRLIARKLSPKGSKLVKYIDGWLLTEFEFGYEVEGKRIDFNVPKCYWLSGHPNLPPVAYTSLELAAVMQKQIKTYIKQFQCLLHIKKFELSGVELSGKRTKIAEQGKERFVSGYIISGKYLGKDLSFAVDNFEKENLAKRIK